MSGASGAVDDLRWDQTLQNNLSASAISGRRREAVKDRGESELRDSQTDHVTLGLRQSFARHRFDHRPVLAEKLRRIVEVRSLHFDAAGLPSALAGDLKVEGETDCVPIVA